MNATGLLYDRTCYNQGTNPIPSERCSATWHAGRHRSTDWSWAPVVADFDRDGFRGSLSPTFPKDITDRDFMDYQVNYYAYVEQHKMLVKSRSQTRQLRLPE